MSLFPVTPLVREVQGLIVQAFEVSEPEAEEFAAELVALAEGWGSRESAASQDWSYRVRKHLGKAGKLKWRSEEERAGFEAAESERHARYEFLIDTKHRA
ncbi:hypothetical protein OJ996_23280 [Luteolibacter sp. GHJ8]|uniref:Uncharacterized protein n=1 Tax=Luteolibacter rhizosphaerae TaxID=2989719 RepID=A0ABT3GAL6_9BACT|nr:hypothetical protein [Luteolibacter rhizosphaerae]MCW1916529.1 hypothetical protein [Luteolibacter rhizosphaerae]